MTEQADRAGEAGPSHHGVEVGVALAMMVFGAIVIFGSYQIGIGWGPEGPRSGFFPFYIGLLIIGASVVNLVLAATAHGDSVLFAEWGQLRQVLAVVIPTAVYVAVIPYSGLYLASFVLIFLFMIWLGRYRWISALAVASGVILATYFMFEKWFLVPLPKGPIEDFFGL